MVVPLKIRITKTNPPSIRLREMNSIIREALVQTGVKWVDEYLPRHFAAGNVQRYQMHARQSKYLRIKMKALKVRTWRRGKNGGDWVPAPKPPRALVWTGSLMNNLLGRSASDFNIKGTSTASKHNLRVPCPTTHPIPAETAPEVTRINQEEFEAMSQFAFDIVVKRLNAIRDVLITDIAA